MSGPYRRDARSSISPPIRRARASESEGGMREEVRSSGTAEPPFAFARSSSPPPTPVASSAGASSPAALTNIASIDWLGSAQASKIGSLSCTGPQRSRPSLSTNAAVSAMESSQPSCRPWERGDLLRRLATFKPSSWFAKPKVAGSLTCAQRGWMNIDNDKIECESCGAHLIFTALASWTPAEVNSAGEAFAEHLDTRHKITCPWRGNYCADSLVQFHVAPSTLIGGYKDRCDGLLQFISLPVIASSAVESMRLTRTTQMDRFLSQPPNFLFAEVGDKADGIPGIDFAQLGTLCSYTHAQKLISLCGWEPRWLPNVQDCEENSTHSARNACSIDPNEDKYHSQFPEQRKNSVSAVMKKDKGKGKMPVKELRSNFRSPLLDCSLCGATVRIFDFSVVHRPSRFSPNNIDTSDTGKKLVLSRGVSAGSAINGWIAAGEVERDQNEGLGEAGTTDEGKSLSMAGVDLNLTMAGGLRSTQSVMPAMSGHFDDGGMGRDLMIGQPTGSEVGDRAASYESRGPSSQKRNLEEGGSTADKPQADSIEGTVIDRGVDEDDDGVQYSDVPAKRARGIDIFNLHRASGKRGSSGAGPSCNLCFGTDIDVNGPALLKEEVDVGVGPHQSARDSARASSVIAMDTICHNADEDSMDSVENYPGDIDDIHLPSPSIHRNHDSTDALDLNYSNQAQQSVCIQPAAGSLAREIGGSSTNDGEEIANTETVVANARGQFSIGGISGGSVGMGASHEAEIHGIDFSLHRTGSIVGEAEPVTEVTQNLGHTGESVPGPGLMDESVQEEIGREDPHGDSQDMVSRSMGRADSGSKIYGSTKADSVESGEKISRPLGHDSSMHPSLSCNAMIYSGFEVSKGEVTQNGKVSATDAFLASSYDPGNRTIGATNEENNFEAEIGEFDPIKHHNSFCPWVNGNVAAACCNGNNDSNSSSYLALCGWQLTLDALDTFQSIGHVQNQTMQSESAASLCKDDHVTRPHKLVTRPSASKNQGKY